MPAKLEVFSLRAGQAELSFDVHPGPCLPGLRRRTLLLTEANGQVHAQTFDVTPGMRVRFLVAVPPGTSRLEVLCPDTPTVLFPSDARVMLVGMTQARLALIDPVVPPPPPRRPP